MGFSRAGLLAGSLLAAGLAVADSAAGSAGPRPACLAGVVSNWAWARAQSVRLPNGQGLGLLNLDSLSPVRMPASVARQVSRSRA
jgi:hypothetical protein